MKQELTNRERILATLQKKEVDRLCWSPLIDSYFINSLPQQNLYMEIIEAMRYIGNDIMERHVASPTPVYQNVTIEEKWSPDGQTKRISYITPVGTIYQEKKLSGETIYTSKNLIETLEDVKVYQYIAENTSFTDNIKAFAERDQYIGDDGIATPEAPMTPIQSLLQDKAGVENTVFLMADYPDEMDELMEAMHERNKRECEILVKYPTEVAIGYEDTSSTVMSKNMFLNYSAPQIDDYARIFHDNGKSYITHMCGKLSVFAKEIGAGMQDGIDSVCPPTTGDLCAWDARKIWGQDKVIIGGIEPPALARMTVDQTIAYVDEIMRNMKGQRGFILSTGDATSFGTPIENLIAITKHVKTVKW